MRQILFPGRLIAVVLACALAAGCAQRAPETSFALKANRTDPKQTGHTTWVARWSHAKPIALQRAGNGAGAFLKGLGITVTEDDKDGGKATAKVSYTYYNAVYLGGPQTLRFTAKDAAGNPVESPGMDGAFALVDLPTWACQYNRGRDRPYPPATVHESLPVTSDAVRRVKSMEVAIAALPETRPCPGR